MAFTTVPFDDDILPGSSNIVILKSYNKGFWYKLFPLVSPNFLRIHTYMRVASYGL